jgi:hypothetical protein
MAEFLRADSGAPGAFPLSVFYPLHRYSATNGTFVGVFEDFCRYMGFYSSGWLPEPATKWMPIDDFLFQELWSPLHSYFVEARIEVFPPAGSGTTFPPAHLKYVCLLCTCVLANRIKGFVRHR